LIAGVLIFAIVQLVKFILALGLPSLPLTVPAWYLALSGAFWSTLALLSVFGLLKGAIWAPTILRWGSAAFAAWFWTDWILFIRSDYSRGSWPFNLAFTIVALAAIVWSLQRSAVKRYFGERHDE
jgi:hypothetical protein